MIRPNSAKTHTLILPNTNKALAEVLKTLPKEKIAHLQSAKDLTTLLHSLLKGNMSDEVQNKALLELLKNTPTFKNLGDFSSSIKELLSTLQKQNTHLPVEKTLQDMLQNIREIDSKTLQKKLENSGIVLESKLKNATNQNRFKEIFSNDFKAQLLHTKELVENASMPNKTHILQHIDKLLLQIDYYQLLSHLGNNTAFYIPYNFDALDSGHFSIKKAKENHFFCDINLTLKKYGELFVRLGLFDHKDLNINIHTQSDLLQNKLKTHTDELQQHLKSVGFRSCNIRFLTIHNDNYSQTYNDLHLGFEAKV